MGPTVAELLAALPSDEPVVEPAYEPAKTTASADNRLSEILSQLAQRPVPVGSLRRLWTLGGLQAKLALAYLAYFLRTWFATPEAKSRQLMKTNLRSALRMLETMGYLRGAIMKVGQALATFPEILPDEFAELLGSLHFEAPPMHYGLLQEHLENELGAEPEKVFRSFEPLAFAAASLGQVHRAQLPSGEAVAVKLQYPGVASTIRSDVDNLRRLMLPLRLSRDWESLTEQLTEVQSVLESETDYVQEANNLRESRAAFQDADGIIVPRVYEQYSTGRVLTMEYVDGLHLKAFLARCPSQEERNRFGERIVRASARLYFSRRLLYSDFNPGNVLFCADGRLGLIDFGGLRRFNDEEWEYLQLADEAMRSNDPNKLFAHIQRGLLFTDEEMRTKSHIVEVVGQWNEFYWQPLRTAGEFDFGDSAFFGRAIDLWKSAAKVRALRQQPLNIFFHRCLFEQFSLLYRLRARFDHRAVYEEETQATGWHGGDEQSM